MSTSTDPVGRTKLQQQYSLTSIGQEDGRDVESFVTSSFHFFLPLLSKAGPGRTRVEHLHFLSLFVQTLLSFDWWLRSVLPSPHPFIERFTLAGDTYDSLNDTASSPSLRT